MLGRNHNEIRQHVEDPSDIPRCSNRFSIRHMDHPSVAGTIDRTNRGHIDTESLPDVLCVDSTRHFDKDLVDTDPKLSIQRRDVKVTKRNSLFPEINFLFNRGTKES